MSHAARTLDATDLFDLTSLSDPVLSADGRRLFAVRSRIEPGDARPARNDAAPAAAGPVGTAITNAASGSDAPKPPRTRSEVVELDPASADAATGTASLRVVARGRTDGTGAEHPRPSPDGRRLAWLAPGPDDRRGTQIWLADLARGGEPVRLTDLPGGVRAFDWRPDGSALAAIGRTERHETDDARVVARSATRLHVKQDGLPGAGLRPSAPTVTGLVPVDADVEATGRDGFVPLPSAPDGPTALAWSPDGTALWSLGPSDADEGDAWRSSLWRLPLDAGGAPTGVLERFGDGLHAPSGLSVARDGASVAWLASTEPDAFATPTGLWTSPVDAFAPELRTDPDLDLAPATGGDARYGRYRTEPVPADGGGWTGVAGRDGASAPVRIDADGTVTDLAPGGRVVTSLAVAGSRRIVLFETPDAPGRLARLAEDGPEPTVLYDPNEELGARFRFATLEGPFLAADRAAPEMPGTRWWRLPPREARADGAQVLQVHGGPHTSAGYGFVFEHQLLASRGYAVIVSNPRGSSGSGRAHATALLGRYGTVDADDVLRVADAAAASHVPADAPMHLTGGSYGGFMTNWLVGRTDRFASAVTQRSICDWLSFYGTSDIGYRFAAYEVGGRPWSDRDRLWEQSPLAHVARVTTPILILHADQDHRCPVEQAEQWYVALRTLGRAEARLVRFPEEGHELSRSGRPDRRVRRLREIVDWFETHPGRSAP